jgi:hypothetical protein
MNRHGVRAVGNAPYALRSTIACDVPFSWPKNNKLSPTLISLMFVGPYQSSELLLAKREALMEVVDDFSALRFASNRTMGF